MSRPAANYKRLIVLCDGMVVLILATVGGVFLVVIMFPADGQMQGHGRIYCQAVELHSPPTLPAFPER